MNNLNNSLISRNQEVLSYLIDRLGTRNKSRKKLMKLMFLVEHYDLNSEKLTDKQFLGNDFIIYKYGVFSSDVMEDLLELNTKGILEDYPIRLLKEIPFDLKKEITSREDSILMRFGDKFGYQLENFTLGLLHLNKETKKKYLGQSVIPLIRAVNRGTKPVFTHPS